MLDKRQNPIRLRSTIYLLIYPLVDDLVKFKDFLEFTFSIKSSTDWKYVIKQEHYTDSSGKTLVFVELTTKSDVYSAKLGYPLQDVQLKGAYWTLSDRDLGLLYIFKQHSTWIEHELLTNIDAHELLTYYQCVSLSRKTRYSVERAGGKKQLTDKQVRKIKAYVTQIYNELESALPNVQLLHKFVNNIRNYRYTYNLTEQVNAEITKCELLVSEIKKTL